jgi:hypothetical protein
VKGALQGDHIHDISEVEVIHDRDFACAAFRMREKFTRGNSRPSQLYPYISREIS